MRNLCHILLWERFASYAAGVTRNRQASVLVHNHLYAALGQGRTGPGTGTRMYRGLCLDVCIRIAIQILLGHIATVRFDSGVLPSVRTRLFGSAKRRLNRQSKADDHFAERLNSKAKARYFLHPRSVT